ncbi:MAG: glycine cleavage system protein GcvH [Candidatus Acidoferrales bacterium]
MYPKDYRYTKEHEWIKVDSDIGTVGITHHAQEKLGDIILVELPKVGAHLKAMELFGTVESVKFVADFYSPVSGSVTEVNTALGDNPALVNQDPHGGAWLVKVKITHPKELDRLLTADAYQKFIESEAAEQ